MPIGASITLYISVVVLMLVGLTFSTLDTEDTGEELEVHFGPLPLIRKRIRYDEIDHFSASRSTWIEGWGLRYTTQGWLWNARGFDCVLFKVKGKTFRIGTNDMEALLQHLEEKCPRAGAMEESQESTSPS